MEKSACVKLECMSSIWGDVYIPNIEVKEEISPVKKIRHGFRTFKDLEKNKEAKKESDRLFDVLNNKFRLYRSEGWGAGRKTSIIQVIDENSISGDWLPYPRSKQIQYVKKEGIYDPLNVEDFEKRINIGEGLRRIRRQIISDPFLNISLSHRKLSKIDILGFEADVIEDGNDVLVDEDVIDRYKNDEVVAKLNELGLHPHFSTSGNRSIYTWFFFTEDIPREMLSASVEFLSHVLRDVEIDCISTEACVRIPTSYYYQTGRLARFYGIESREDNLQYIENIQRDDFNGETYYDAIEKFRLWLKEKSLISTASIIDASSDDFIPTSPVILDGTQEYDRTKYASSFAGDHPLRDYFEGILSCGFNHDSHQAFKKSFYLWACHKYGDKDLAYHAIQAVIHLNPNDYAVQDRQRRLDWLYARVNFDPRLISDKSSFDVFEWSDEDLRFLTEMRRRLESSFKSSRAKCFYQVAEWCYYLGRINNGRCGLGGEVIAKRFGIAVKNAYNALGLFWKRSNRLESTEYGNKFNFLRIDKFHTSPVGEQKGKVREFCLDVDKFWAWKEDGDSDK